MRRVFTLKRSSLLVASGLVLLWLLQNSVGERSGATALLTYLPQHGFGVLPMGLLLGCLRRRQKPLAILNGVSLLFWLFALLGFQLPSGQSNASPTLRIVSYNVLGGKSDAARIARDIQLQQPDIACLQESQNGFGARVAAHFPGWTQRSSGDVTTISRFPMVSMHVHPQLGRRRLLETVWQTPQGLVRVHNVHISMQPRERVVASSSGLVRIFTSNRAKAMARLEQLPDLERLPREGMPTLLCGDFNTPPRGLFYRALGHGWNDAFAQSGFGLGQSWPSVFPLLRIDYVWMRGLHSRRSWVAEAGESDHRPFVCDVWVSK